MEGGDHLSGSLSTLQSPGENGDGTSRESRVYEAHYHSKEFSAKLQISNLISTHFPVIERCLNASIHGLSRDRSSQSGFDVLVAPLLSKLYPEVHR